MGGGWPHRADLCGVSLAKSGARASDVRRRGRDGVDVRARAKHHPAGVRAGGPRAARRMGVPVSVASPHACWTWILHVEAVAGMERVMRSGRELQWTLRVPCERSMM